MKWMRALVASASAGTLLAACVAGTAGAQPSSPLPDSPIEAPSRTAMTVQKEVSAVTKGDEVVVTLDNGKSFTIPAAEYRQAQSRVKQSRARHGVQPQNTVFGNCGYSYTYLYDWGNRTYRLAVGFHVDAPAIDYSWGAYVNGAGSTYYEYHYTAGGGLAWRTNWAGGHTGTVPRADYYDADTYWGAAELWYGSWCFAAYTSDYTYVS